MRQLLIALGVAFTVQAALAQDSDEQLLRLKKRSHIVSGGGVSWTLVHHSSSSYNFSCTGTSTGTAACSVTATVSGGDLLVFASTLYFGYGSGVLQPTYGSASGDTFTHCPSAALGVIKETTGGGAYILTDCAYVLSAAAQTSHTYTFNWTTSSGGGITPQWWLDVDLLEYHRSTGTAAYDAANNTNSSSCTTCAAPSSLSISATDVVIQWGGFDNVPSAISGAYTQPADFDSSNLYGAYAGALNVTSYSAPSWTQASAGNYAGSVIAFK
jgi:hypothetical protein